MEHRCQISIASRAERRTLSLIMCVVAIGCTDAGHKNTPSTAPEPPSVAPVENKPDTVSSPDSPMHDNKPQATPNARIVTITQFDCSKSEDLDANATPAALPGLSTWRAGGPGGATWNATDLTCFAKVQTSCEIGELKAMLHVGQRSAGMQTLALSRGGEQRVEMVVPENIWRRGLDPKRTGPALPVSTAVFSLRAEVSCEKPLEVAPGMGPYRDVSDHSSFLAGFANGE